MKKFKYMKMGIYRKYLAMNLSKKIMVMLLLISIIPIIFIQYVSNKVSTNIVEKQTKELIMTNLEQLQTSVEDFLENYDKIIMDIYTDNAFIQWLEYINIWDSKNYYTAKHEIEGKLENIIQVNKDILGIAIIGLNGDYALYDAVSFSGVNSFCFDTQNFRVDPFIKESLTVKHTIYSNTIHKYDPKYDEKDILYIAHPLMNFNDSEKGPIGSIVICIDENALRETYSTESGSVSNITFIANQDGYIISFPNDKYIGEKLNSKHNLANGTIKFFSENKLMNSKRLQVDFRRIKDNAFVILNVQDLNYALKSARYISIIIILIGLLVCVFSILISMTFAYTTDRSVKKIICAMDRANKGNYNVRIHLKGQDEFSLIGNHFNDMINKIKFSNQQKEEALIRKKNAEIRSLEAQINPHFLYNTLDTINWIAIEQEEYLISKMINQLAQILRYSISGSNEIVTIGQDLEFLEKYIHLQQQRFDYAFSYKITVDETVKKCKIHKLLIQPLIENIIVHGFPGNSGKDFIIIEIKLLDQDKIEILVEDNGKGMNRELVEFFNQYDSKEDYEETGGIGVRNVITRVKLYYGENSNFHMHSDDYGTKIVIQIPYEYE